MRMQHPAHLRSRAIDLRMDWPLHQVRAVGCGPVDAAAVVVDHDQVFRSEGLPRDGSRLDEDAALAEAGAEVARERGDAAVVEDLAAFDEVFPEHGLTGHAGAY